MIDAIEWGLNDFVGNAEVRRKWRRALLSPSEKLVEYGNMINFVSERVGHGAEMV